MILPRYSSVPNLLRRNGPNLSSSIAAALTREGASPANARKLIQRAAPDINRLAEIVFPHNEAFLYLPEHHDTALFWTRLLAAFQQTNSAYGYAIDSLRSRGGTVPGEYFSIVSGSPTRLKGHVSAERIRDSLQRLGVLSVGSHPVWGSVITLKPHIPGIKGTETARARMLAEDITADATRTFIQRMGLGSYAKVIVRTPLSAPVFGAFKWDITAPCYAAPLRRFVRGKKNFTAGFLIADVFLGVEVGLEEIKPFLAKSQIMRSNPKTPLFLSMLIADSFSKEALYAGKAVGHLMVTTETLFSKDLAEALRALIEVLTRAATAAATYPELVYDLFDQLSTLEGAAANMRGPLFELWLARYLYLEGWQVTGVGKKLRVQETGDEVEVDVLGEKAGGLQIRACEAKAHASPVSGPEVQDWIKRQIPRIRRALLQYRDGRSPQFIFEFWTTNIFSPEALEILQAAAARTTTYQIKWVDGLRLLSLANQIGDTYLTKILNDFFLRNTTSTRLLQAQRRRSQLAHLSTGRMQRPASEDVSPISTISYEAHL